MVGRILKILAEAEGRDYQKQENAVKLIKNWLKNQRESGVV